MQQTTINEILQEAAKLGKNACGWLEFPWEQVAAVYDGQEWQLSHSITEQEFTQLESARFFTSEHEIAWFPNAEGQLVRRDIDNPTDKVETVSFNQIIMGTEAIIHDQNFYRLSSEKGSRVYVPRTLVEDNISPKLRLALEVQYIIDYDSNGLGFFKDCRFVKFVTVGASHE